MEPSLYGPAMLLDDHLTIRNCREHLAQYHQWLAQRFQAGDNILELVERRSDFMDGLLEQLWRKFELSKQPQLALVAVGGYGRSELHPCSDIDLLVLSASPLSQAAADGISEFITFLWDIRLEVGHSVRSIEECFEEGVKDITVATNLLESRLICGSEAAFETLQERISGKSFWPSEAFFKAKRDEQRARHAQFAGKAYSLEPDIKSNPGGLRDIQTLSWVARRHFGASTLLEMVTHGFMTEAEYRELLECQNFLWRLRFALHLESQRGDNRLLFDRQMAVAKALSYPGEGNKGVERMMKRFYQTIRRVSELNEMLLQLFDEAILGNAAVDITPLDEHFQLRGELIDARQRDLFRKHPPAILEMFLHIARRPEIKGVYSATLRQLREARRRLPTALQEIPGCQEVMCQLLHHPQTMGTSFTLMHKYGIMAAYLPAWSMIVGQMQFDLFHAYTVDEHTHRLVQQIYRFRETSTKKYFPLCAEIYPRLRKPELLFIGAIFHDIAKGRNGDHSELGAAEALEFCRRHRYDQTDAKLVAWMVESHLLMSVTAQRRDIHDPEVIREFAGKVQDEEHLDYLYCLTVADICATNDDLWNSWKAALMQELYFVTQKALHRGLEHPVDVRGRIRENQREAKRQLLARGWSEPQLQQLWHRFKADYFLRHSPQQIVWHSEGILEHPGDRRPLVLVSKRPLRGGTEIFLYCREQPDLFATVVTELDQKNLTVHDAHVMSSKDGFVLDTFVVLEPDGSPIPANRVAQLKESLEKVVASDTQQAPRIRRLKRQLRQFKVPTEVTFLNSKSSKRTLMELVALDMPGLLAKIGSVFQQLNISLQGAKIITIGERVEDLFILSDGKGNPLSTSQKLKLQDRLISELSNPHDIK